MTDRVAPIGLFRRGAPRVMPEPLTDQAARRLTDRLLFGLSYYIVAAACLFLLPGGHRLTAAAPVAAILFVVSQRFQLKLSVGWIGYQQASFVFLMFTLPLNLVPLAVLVCQVAGELTTSRRRGGAILSTGCNSWWALAATVAMAELSPGHAQWSQWSAYLAVFGCQFAADNLIYGLRARLAGRSLNPSEALTVLAMDAALTVVGLAAAVELRNAPGAAIAIMVGITTLLAIIDREHDLRLAESERALRDPLTGLANRALFTEAIAACESRCRRNGSQAGLLLIDLDEFKLINDGYGHQAGDEALIFFADGLRGAVRAADIPARIGGDEFAVILAEPTDLEGAQRAADHLRRQLATPITLSSGQSVEVAFSIGMSLVGGAANPADASAEADRALYGDKRARKLV